MKAVIITIGLIGLVGGLARGQVLVQDADGKSTVRYSGNAINLDVAKSRVSFAVNSYGNERESDKHKTFFWGIQAAATSKNGLAGLINGGTVVPEGTGTLTLGRTWTTGTNEKLATAERALRQLYATRGNTVRTLSLALNDLRADTYQRLSKDTLLTADLEQKLKAIFDNSGYGELEEAFEKLADAQTNKATRLALQLEATRIAERLTPFQTLQDESASEVAKYRDQVRRSYWRGRHLVYGLAGVAASSFSYQQSTAVTGNLGDRFVDKSLESFLIGVGYNYQRAGNYMLGFNIVGQKADNFTSLTPTEYTLVNTTQVTSTTALTAPTASTVIAQRSEDKKTFTGYAGNYKVYYQTSLNADYVKFFKGDEADDGVVALNGYIRYRISSEPDFIPTTLALGTGAYFFKNNGTFVGGIYLELPDIFNAAEALKTEPNFKSFYRRVSFGVVTKFNLNSIISYGL